MVHKNVGDLLEAVCFPFVFFSHPKTVKVMIKPTAKPAKKDSNHDSEDCEMFCKSMECHFPPAIPSRE